MYPERVFINCYVFSSTTSYVFITGIDNLSIYRLTVISGVVTNSELFTEYSYPDFFASGTYVIDEDNIKVILSGFFTSAFYREVGLGLISLNGASSTIGYQRGLPYYSGWAKAHSGVFASPSKYYFCLEDINIFRSHATNSGNIEGLPRYSMVILSSDSSETC